MAYVLEKMSKEDQQKILDDVRIDETRRRLLRAREYFDRHPNLTWAVDLGRWTVTVTVTMIIGLDLKCDCYWGHDCDHDYDCGL